MAKQKFYRLNKILKTNAHYNVIFGERSSGKTFAVLELGIKNFVENGKQLAIVRRWNEDFIGKRGQQMFDALVTAGVVKELTGGEWTNVYYFASKWFLCRYENGDRITHERPFAYGFSITSMEHDKSTSYPDVTTICFDEFLTRTVYLPDEFVLFCNVISTIVRSRTDVKIFMLGNTVNKYCPYFAEMGLKHIKDMKPGDIDIYKYGEEGKLIVAVEYTTPNKAGKQSDIYFAFDNPKLQMITSGAWEIEIYPHCPIKYKPKDILFTFFIIFDDQMLQCEVILTNGQMFTFIHKKTTELKNPDQDIIYTTGHDPRPNWRRNILRPANKIDQRISKLIRDDKIFYSDNETGEVMRNYLIWCKSN